VSAVLGLALVLLSLFVNQWTGRQNAATKRDEALRSDVEIQASRADEYFSTARKIVSQLAQNPALAAAYDDPSSRTSLVPGMNRALSFVESDLYPGLLHRPQRS
jgi:hypothetical protein